MQSILKNYDVDVFNAIENEIKRQQDGLELIASENYVSEAVLEAQGSVLTNKYAEGYPGKRYYGGCEFVDVAENLARDRAKKLFNCEHSNVQPHSGSQANMAVYMSVLKPGDLIMGMNLSHGGHLTHGHPMNFSGFLYKVVAYGVDKDTETIDYESMEKLALEHKPKMIVAGASAYPRVIDFSRIRSIADKVGAIMMVDIAHIAGLIVAGLHPSPVPVAEFVTTTTHKTLRGPRGGMVMCKNGYAKALDTMVLPGIQGGPLMHIIAAKAVAFAEALKPDFKRYQEQVIKNAKALAKALSENKFRIVSGGTDNHLILVDLRSKGVTGKIAQGCLEKAGITVNKNTIPFDPEKPFVTSGIRLGTPALTTRGMKEKEMDQIAGWIDEAIKYKDDDKKLAAIKDSVDGMCKGFPVYERVPA